jgi:hypothetical protein
MPCASCCAKVHFLGLMLSAVMPAYDEQATLRTIVARVLVITQGADL